MLAFPFLSSTCSGRAVFLNNARQVLFRFWWISVFSLCSIYAEVKEIALQVTGNILKKPTAALCKEQPPQMLKLQSYQCSFVEWLLAASPLLLAAWDIPVVYFTGQCRGSLRGWFMPRCRVLSMALQELLFGGRQISRMCRILLSAEGCNLGWFATIRIPV